MLILSDADYNIHCRSNRYISDNQLAYIIYSRCYKRQSIGKIAIQLFTVFRCRRSPLDGMTHQQNILLLLMLNKHELCSVNG